MITKIEFAQPFSALDDSSKTTSANRLNRAMATGADDATPQAGASIPRMCDFSDVLNWNIQDADGLQGFVSTMSQETADAFMEAAQAVGPHPSLIMDDINLDGSDFDPNSSIGSGSNSESALGALYESNPFFGDHEGQTYNFRLRLWEDA